MATTKYPTNILKQHIDDHEKRIVTIERTTDVHEERIRDLRGDVDKNYDAISRVNDWRMDVDKIIVKSAQAINIGTWIMAGFGLSVIALIWALITGQATLIFK